MTLGTPPALMSNPIIGLAAFLLAAMVDNYLTLRAARLLEAGANHVFRVEGSYELNPLFTSDIDRDRPLSPRFLLLLFLYSIFLVAVWFVSIRLMGLPQLYAFTLGAILLIQGPVQVRHVRNLVSFGHAKDRDGISGRIELSRRFSYTSSAAEFGAFAGLYLLLGLLALSWLLVGGAFGCALLGLSHRRLSIGVKSE